MKLLTSFFCLFALGLNAATVHDTLYINAGTATMYDGTTFPFKAFNGTDQFEGLNKLVRVMAGDDLELVVINNDTEEHGFGIWNTVVVPQVIQPGDTGYVSHSFPDLAAFIYYDHLDFPNNSYMGLSGILAVLGTSDSEYYWDMKTHDSIYSAELDAGNPVDWNSYDPDHFTINGKGFPAALSDTLINISGSIGDVVHIYMTGAGRSMHSMHFHGYHATILYSSQSPHTEGRSKDTFPIDPMETMVLELIPNQIGLYPIHDHNLVAITGSGTYLNGGILVTVHIQ